MLGLLCPYSSEILYSLARILSILVDPPFSVMFVQHSQHAFRGVIRFDGRAVLGPVAKLHRHLGRIDHLRIGRTYGDYVVPEWWRSYAFALTVIVDKVKRCL